MNDLALIAVTKIVDDLERKADTEEGFSPELLDFVDLDIEYSPVIAIRGGFISDAVDVMKTIGGRYLVKHSAFTNPVEPEALKRMRLRYLLAVKQRQRPAIEGLFK